MVEMINGYRISVENFEDKGNLEDAGIDEG
jgi:hypothetical protein